MTSMIKAFFLRTGFKSSSGSKSGAAADAADDASDAALQAPRSRKSWSPAVMASASPRFVRKSRSRVSWSPASLSSGSPLSRDSPHFSRSVKSTPTRGLTDLKEFPETDEFGTPRLPLSPPSSPLPRPHLSSASSPPPPPTSPHRPLTRSSSFKTASAAASAAFASLLERAANSPLLSRRGSRRVAGVEPSPSRASSGSGGRVTPAPERLGARALFEVGGVGSVDSVSSGVSSGVGSGVSSGVGSGGGGGGGGGGIVGAETLPYGFPSPKPNSKFLREVGREIHVMIPTEEKVPLLPEKRRLMRRDTSSSPWRPSLGDSSSSTEVTPANSRVNVAAPPPQQPPPLPPDAQGDDRQTLPEKTSDDRRMGGQLRRRESARSAKAKGGSTSDLTPKRISLGEEPGYVTIEDIDPRRRSISQMVPVTFPETPIAPSNKNNNNNNNIFHPPVYSKSWKESPTKTSPSRSTSDAGNKKESPVGATRSGFHVSTDVFQSSDFASENSGPATVNPSAKTSHPGAAAGAVSPYAESVIDFRRDEPRRSSGRRRRKKEEAEGGKSRPPECRCEACLVELRRSDERRLENGKVENCGCTDCRAKNERFVNAPPLATSSAAFAPVSASAPASAPLARRSSFRSSAPPSSKPTPSSQPTSPFKPTSSAQPTSDSVAIEQTRSSVFRETHFNDPQPQTQPQLQSQLQPRPQPQFHPQPQSPHPQAHYHPHHLALQQQPSLLPHQPPLQHGLPLQHQTLVNQQRTVSLQSPQHGWHSPSPHPSLSSHPLSSPLPSPYCCPLCSPPPPRLRRSIAHPVDFDPFIAQPLNSSELFDQSAHPINSPSRLINSPSRLINSPSHSLSCPVHPLNSAAHLCNCSAHPVNAEVRLLNTPPLLINCANHPPNSFVHRLNSPPHLNSSISPTHLLISSPNDSFNLSPFNHGSPDRRAASAFTPFNSPAHLPNQASHAVNSPAHLFNSPIHPPNSPAHVLNSANFHQTSTPLSSLNSSQLPTSLLNSSGLEPTHTDQSILNSDPRLVSPSLDQTLIVSADQLSHLNPSPFNQSRQNSSHLNQSLSPLNSSHLNQSELNSSHSLLNSSHLNSSHLNSSHLNSSHLNQSELNSSHSPIISSHLNSSHLNSSHLNSSHLNSSLSPFNMYLNNDEEDELPSPKLIPSRELKFTDFGGRGVDESKPKDNNNDDSSSDKVGHQQQHQQQDPRLQRKDFSMLQMLQMQQIQRQKMRLLRVDEICDEFEAKSGRSAAKGDDEVHDDEDNDDDEYITTLAEEEEEEQDNAAAEAAASAADAELESRSISGADKDDADDFVVKSDAGSDIRRAASLLVDAVRSGKAQERQERLSTSQEQKAMPQEQLQTPLTPPPKPKRTAPLSPALATRRSVSPQLQWTVNPLLLDSPPKCRRPLERRRLEREGEREETRDRVKEKVVGVEIKGLESVGVTTGDVEEQTRGAETMESKNGKIPSLFGKSTDLRENRNGSVNEDHAAIPGSAVALTDVAPNSVALNNVAFADVATNNVPPKNVAPTGVAPNSVALNDVAPNNASLANVASIDDRNTIVSMQNGLFIPVTSSIRLSVTASSLAVTTATVSPATVTPSTMTPVTFATPRSQILMGFSALKRKKKEKEKSGVASWVEGQSQNRFVSTR